MNLSADGDVDAQQSDFTPYSSSLEFFDDYFQLLVQQIRLSNKILSKKVENVEEDLSPWERTSRQGHVNLGEFEARVRILQARIEERLSLTKRKRLPLPRLEQVCEKLSLDAFEKRVVCLLIGFSLSPLIQKALKDIKNLLVSDILQIFCPTFKEQVEKRTYFYRSAKLVQRGIIRLRSSSHYMYDDLADYVVTIDRRMMDWVVGLNTEINELIEGSNLYTPKVDMDHVVLSLIHI